MKEKIAVREAQRLGIPVFAMVDTNSNPEGIDFVIPANDDASQSIDLIIGVMAEAIKEGLSERKVEREKEGGDEKPAKQKRGSRKAAAKDKEAEPAKEPAKEEAPKAEAPKAEAVKEEAKEAPAADEKKDEEADK
jgi:small subunit ribosomal protein S2